ncbi:MULTISPECIES: PilZ domain-containing protein [Gammaproteobacteria]|jgi:hypothetical protein|uniref:PilZ domain-containing protein n=1 Tax=Gammaproteobacteria TaxID=1236 RepID=UPI00112E5525|nr:PilZ domain-containing protein [Pseudomonas sp. Hp2]
MSMPIQHEAESGLFADALSCELALPAEFRPGAGIARAGAAESVLRSIAQVEDLRSDDPGEDRGELPQAVARMEAKLDLVLALIGHLARQSGQALPLRPVRWSRRGIRLETGARSGAMPGAAGTLSLQPADWLPENIELPVAVVAEAASGTGGFFLWLRFGELGPGLEAALERHLFRLHRRQVADARRAR